MAEPTTQTRERPILFSAGMVRAILDGKKTQTRRVINPQPLNRVYRINGEWIDADGIDPGKIIRCPWQIGDRLFNIRFDIAQTRDVRKMEKTGDVIRQWNETVRRIKENVFA